jgi:hypothetical protein
MSATRPSADDGNKVQLALEKSAQRIITHMNADHGDSIKAYLHHYACLDTAVKGELTAISVVGMTITATLECGKTVADVFVPYASGALESAGAIRSVVVAMHKEAYGKLGYLYRLQNGYYTTAAGHIIGALKKSRKAQVGVTAMVVVAAYGVNRYLRK